MSIVSNLKLCRMQEQQQPFVWGQNPLTASTSPILKEQSSCGKSTLWNKKTSGSKIVTRNNNYSMQTVATKIKLLALI